MRKFITLAAAIFISIGPSGCGKKEVNRIELPNIETFQLQSQNFTPSLTLTGTIEAQKSIALSSKVSGRIDSLLVDNIFFFLKRL